jgi:hypothetical protein
MKLKDLRMPGAACVLAASLFSITPASAAVIGHLDVANCGGGGVTVNATTIDFTLPAGGGFGCIVTGTGTNVSYSGGTLLPGVTGSILDLVAGGGIVLDFMTFVGNPNLHFDLTALGPGVINTACAAVLDPNLPSCSVVAGSPFILAPTSTGTSITLSASGIARDGSVPTSTFIGAFTTQIAGVTPASIAATIGGGGSVSSTNSGDFTITLSPTVPEPSTVSIARQSPRVPRQTRSRRSKRRRHRTRVEARPAV